MPKSDGFIIRQEKLTDEFLESEINHYKLVCEGIYRINEYLKDSRFKLNSHEKSLFNNMKENLERAKKVSEDFFNYVFEQEFISTGQETKPESKVVFYKSLLKNSDKEKLHLKIADDDKNIKLKQLQKNMESVFFESILLNEKYIKQLGSKTKEYENFFLNKAYTKSSQEKTKENKLSSEGFKLGLGALLSPTFQRGPRYRLFAEEFNRNIAKEKEINPTESFKTYDSWKKVPDNVKNRFISIETATDHKLKVQADILDIVLKSPEFMSLLEKDGYSKKHIKKAKTMLDKILKFDTKHQTLLQLLETNSSKQQEYIPKIQNNFQKIKNELNKYDSTILAGENIFKSLQGTLNKIDSSREKNIESAWRNAKKDLSQSIPKTGLFQKIKQIILNKIKNKPKVIVIKKNEFNALSKNFAILTNTGESLKGQDNPQLHSVASKTESMPSKSSLNSREISRTSLSSQNLEWDHSTRPRR
ncbi:MAG: hypothetical protein JWM09_344 [Francisellaceae bacterium]|nr:hypothetical protein [Francisellaceae bacterium]